MYNDRRKFLKLTALAGTGLLWPAGTRGGHKRELMTEHIESSFSDASDDAISLIGPYGKWAAGVMEEQLPTFSLRTGRWSDAATWRRDARETVFSRMAVPDLGGPPSITVKRKYEYDGLLVEELLWQLPYGRPTEAVLLKPASAKEPLPGVLAFHDHGGNKYFGTKKITRTDDSPHPLIEEHQSRYYEKRAWANELAKRGYVVLVSDAFPFASRRVMLQDVPSHLRQGLTDASPEDSANIRAYNQWAAEHEHVMAKSLFSAGTTWPGVFFAEDRIALDILCARPDVDASRIGCGGLSGGGMRTVFMGGLDDRIKCAVCVGFMTTWKDFVLNKSYTHTWMTYVPLLPNELDFPEILGLRVPLPTLVLNDEQDQLYTLSEMKRADQLLAEIYSKNDAAQRYRCTYYPGPHKFDVKMQTEAFEWFDRWLR